MTREEFKADVICRIDNLSDYELGLICGGTFNPNTYSKSGYHTFGINTEYHFFSKDVFYFMGHKINHSKANEIMEIGNKVLTALNSGLPSYQHITASDPAFIRAFNSQLKIKYGADWLWNGKKGCDC